MSDRIDAYIQASDDTYGEILLVSLEQCASSSWLCGPVDIFIPRELPLTDAFPVTGRPLLESVAERNGRVLALNFNKSTDWFESCERFLLDIGYIVKESGEIEIKEKHREAHLRLPAYSERELTHGRGLMHFRGRLLASLVATKLKESMSISDLTSKYKYVYCEVREHIDADTEQKFIMWTPLHLCECKSNVDEECVGLHTPETRVLLNEAIWRLCLTMLADCYQSRYNSKIARDPQSIRDRLQSGEPGIVIQPHECE